MELQNPFESLLAETLDARGRSPRTQETYVWMLRLFGRFVAKPLDQATPEDVRAYQRHLTTERKVGFSSFNQTTCALRFFYRECLGKDWNIERMPYQKKRRTLPEILAPEEVTAILDACTNLKHRALLMTSYSGGLRPTGVQPTEPGSGSARFGIRPRRSSSATVNGRSVRRSQASNSRRALA